MLRFVKQALMIVLKGVKEKYKQRKYWAQVLEGRAAFLCNKLGVQITISQDSSMRLKHIECLPN